MTSCTRQSPGLLRSCTSRRNSSIVTLAETGCAEFAGAFRRNELVTLPLTPSLRVLPPALAPSSNQRLNFMFFVELPMAVSNVSGRNGF